MMKPKIKESYKRKIYFAFQATETEICFTRIKMF